MTQYLDLYAGPKAIKHLQQNGLSQADVDWVFGASGGPKWFVLAGLDEYLFGTFFKDRETRLNTLGSSAGAWRLACLAGSEPVRRIRNLMHGYAELCYESGLNPAQVSEYSGDLLDHVHGELGYESIAQSTRVNSHIITNRSKGWLGSENRFKQASALLATAVANGISRKAMGWMNIRSVFANNASPSVSLWNDLPAESLPLTDNNVRQVLLATGAIPMVLTGEKDIADAPRGSYRDGGTTDYHLDLPVAEEGLILYPHFYPFLLPGWFDKHLGSRFANKAHFDNAIMLVPNQKFIDSLSLQKIPDRKDFANLSDERRVSFFKEVIAQSYQLADEFHELMTTQQWEGAVKPLSWA